MVPSCLWHVDNLPNILNLLSLWVEPVLTVIWVGVVGMELRKMNEDLHNAGSSSGTLLHPTRHGKEHVTCSGASDYDCRQRKHAWHANGESKSAFESDAWRSFFSDLDARRTRHGALGGMVRRRRMSDGSSIEAKLTGTAMIRNVVGDSWAISACSRCPAYITYSSGLTICRKVC